MMRTFHDLPKGADDACDVVIVGTGAAGGAAGRILTDAGLDVVFVEEGPPADRERANASVAAAARHLFRDAGTQVAMGKSVIPVLQGRCVGGSTVINSAICWRIHDDAYDRAFARHGLADAIPLAELHQFYDVIERELHAVPTSDDVAGRNNELMKLGADRLGFGGQPTRRYERGCDGTGRCIQGCRRERKRSLDVTWIPRALARGARLYATCRVVGFLQKGGRINGVRGRLWDPDTGAAKAEVTVRARRGVVLAASAIQTPILLGTLGRLPGRRHLGQHLKAHPGTGVAGLYDDVVPPWLGATQGYEVLHFRHQGVKLESLAIGPELGSVRLAGAGAEFMRHLAEFDHYAVWAAAVRAEAEGHVSGKPGGQARIHFTPTTGDLVKLRIGLRALGEMHFAAGAREIVPSVHGLPVRLTRDQLALLDQAPLDPQAYSLIATHLFGTARMAARPADGVVGTDFQVHGAPGLYVVDSSVFPNNIGVNPQHTIMAVAMAAGARIAA